MKISASIYSRKNEPLREVILRLDEHGIDYYHIDCRDNPAVFEDIAAIRGFSSKPIDLHLITDEPEQYFALLEQHPVDFVAFQYENLREHLVLPESIQGKKGLAITSNTDITVFEAYKETFDFILIMATVPGQSGGRFDKKNFQKIRQFQKQYPDKKIHVDGGVNAEISFILRNMGVFSAVSGSYLFKSNYLGAAMLNLKGQAFSSEYYVKDMMIPLAESPALQPEQHDFESVLHALENYGLGLVAITNKQNEFQGIITNADLRKGILRALPNLQDMAIEEMINRTPVFVYQDHTVSEMLGIIKAQKFPINYLPVLDRDGRFAGVVTFFNLIKGEL